MPKPVTIDFETFGIEARPDYPPVPVGAAIKQPGKKAKYYAWGHATGNNCTRDAALAALRNVWHHPGGLLFHNAKFDVDVAEVHLGLPLPSWDRIHDTVYLTFLDDPHARRIDLKSTAQRLLDWPPDERDAVADWLVEHQPVPNVRISRALKGKEPFGKYIAYAPGDVVGPYAIGDVDRTAALYDRLLASITQRGMLAAYDRERRLLPILLDMERRGVPVDLPRLRGDVASFTAVLARCEAWVLRRLGRVRTPFNIDSGVQLVTALVDAGKADPQLMGVTVTGLVKSDKAAFAAGVTDKPLAAMLRYTTQLKTCLRTFMEPWLLTAERSRGLIYTNWNQTRGASGGTRTGRLSSTPNFQNIPKEFQPIWRDAENPQLPRAPFDLPPLPLCRGYIVARRGQVICDRDFSSQELRVLANFEDGAMAQGYVDDPELDNHQFAADMMTTTAGRTIIRRRAKTIGFSILYGSGVPHLAEQLGVTVNEARALLDAYFRVFPGIRELQRDLKLRAAQGLPIRTIGGREYFCEPPAFVKKRNRIMTFDYKLLNYLVQGSSADLTKDAMIRFYDAVGPGFLLMQVHDELVMSVPTRERGPRMRQLRDAMNDAGLDVPMLSDGKWGTNWAALERATI
jgi:DNA polymerase-1